VRHNSGELAPARGIYHSACRCRVEIKVRPGDRFPQCPKCKGDVAWNFTRAYLQSEGWPAAPPPPPKTS